MSNEEILKKAISKAVRNGWKGLQFPKTFNAVYCIRNHKEKNIIFSHDFAKAFFQWKHYSGGIVVNLTGRHTCNDQCDRRQGGSWQYHLQRMVISENPIKYLEKYL